MSKTGKRSSSYNIPYILEFESLALNILKDGINSKEQLRELLEKYAIRYADDTSGA